MTRLPFIGITNINNKLPSIMTRLPFIRVKKSQQRITFHNDKATIHYSNKTLDNKLPSIMARLPSIGVTKIATTNYLS